MSSSEGRHYRPTHGVGEPTIAKAAQVDAYIVEKLPHNDAALSRAIGEQEKAGMPDIAVSPTQGKYLYLLFKTLKPETVLEYGTLGGYSTIWLARALASTPKAHIWTFEIDEAHAKVARNNLERAGCSDKVTVVVGPAQETASKLIADGTIKSVDAAFIDADKVSCPIYFSQVLSAARPGAIIIVDNVIRQGHLIDATHPSESVHGVRATFDLLSELEQQGYIESTALQTIGEKSWDGFTISYVLKSKPYSQ